MGIKLLLADDSVTIQKVVGIIFAGDEYELTVVDNGNAAIEKAKEVLPDLMLVDALMPGKNGYEVCQTVRQDPALQHLPLLLLTGAFEPFDEDKARQSGADDFITKPFESQQLMDRVAKLLAQAKERQSEVIAPVVAAPEEIVAEQDEWAAMTAPDLSPLPKVSAPEPEAASLSFEAFASAIEEAPAATEPAVQMASADELWGAFEMEEITTAEAGSDVQDLTESQYVAGGDEPLDEASTITGDWGATVADEPMSEVQEAFASEPVAPFAAVPEESAVTFAAEPEEPVAAFSDEAFTVAAPYEPEPAFAPEAEYGVMAIAEPEYVAPEYIAPVVAVPVPVAAPEVVAPTVSTTPSGSVTLTDEQLAQLVAQISRDVIERIAWEVVPDLAETIIKEEIRRIKEGR